MSQHKDNMEMFINGYVTCALWSSTDDNDEPLDNEHSKEDISQSTYIDMVIDCCEFYGENTSLLADIDMNQAGHDFWLTRNGHGAGFWDRGLGEVGDTLTENCKAFPEVDLYVGDDSLIYA